MKNGKNIFGFGFVIWAITSGLLIIGMFIAGPNTAKLLSSIIVTMFWLIVAPTWLYRLTELCLRILASKSTTVLKFYAKYAAYRTSPTDKKSEVVDNPLFFASLRICCQLICALLAAGSFVFKSISFKLVYSALHTCEQIFRGMISPTAIFVLLIFTIILVIAAIIIISIVSKILKKDDADDEDLTHVIILASILCALLLLHIALKCLLLKLGWGIFFIKIATLIAIIIIPIGIIFGYSRLADALGLT